MEAIILLLICAAVPLTMYGLYSIWCFPFKGKYQWRIIQPNKFNYYAEYKNIFGVWRSYLTWDNTSPYGVPYFLSYSEALRWIEDFQCDDEFEPIVYPYNRRELEKIEA